MQREPKLNRAKLRTRALCVTIVKLNFEINVHAFRPRFCCTERKRIHTHSSSVDSLLSPANGLTELLLKKRNHTQSEEEESQNDFSLRPQTSKSNRERRPKKKIFCKRERADRRAASETRNTFDFFPKIKEK